MIDVSESPPGKGGDSRSAEVPPHIHRRPLLRLAGAIVALLLAAALALAWPLHGDPTGRPPARDEATPTTIGPGVARPIASVERAQSSAFAILRGRTMRPPRVTERAIVSTLGAHWDRLGLNLALAHRVHTRAGIIAWVVPGRGFVCVFRNVSGAAGCNTTAETIERGMTLVASASKHPPLRYYALGLAPDGVRAVEIRTGERTVTVAVKDNVYAFRGGSAMTARLIR